MAALTVAWFSRIPQVAAFVTASRLRRLHLRPTHPASETPKWGTQVPEPFTSLNPRGLITYHPEYHSYDPELAMQSLRATGMLGTGWLRTDLRWREILPDGNNPDQQALEWYRKFVSFSDGCGFRNLVVLSTPPDAFFKMAPAAKLDAWSKYVTVVSEALGQWCSAYQMMNEPNGPVYRFFNSQESAVAITRAASTIRAQFPQAHIAVNVSIEIWGWRKYLEQLLRDSGTIVDVVGLDHYPGTWTIWGQGDWSDVIELSSAVATAEPGSLWHGRHICIMETGYSTNAPSRGQEQQKAFYGGLNQVRQLLRQSSIPGLPVLGIYELCDWDSSAGLDPEAHFGILDSQLKPKESFEVVKSLIKEL